ncbi:MAG: hypothetical protein ACPL6D_05480 [Thermodesulfobacteriota bacterium]
MFILLFFDKRACQRIGFINISRFIGEKPGWYLWTKDQKGAYLLELMDAVYFDKEVGTDYPDNIPEVRAEFVLRYYPSTEEPVFEDFSFVEREARLGPYFDHTGTPFFEKQNEIHESLFAVGNLYLDFDKGLNFAILKISSQDRWIQIVKEGTIVETDHRQTIEVIPEGTMARNIPGWELSWRFYDKLLLGFCYVHKTIPFGLGLIEFPGAVYHIYPRNRVIEVHDPDVRSRTLEVGVLLQPDQRPSVDPEVLKEAFFRPIPLSTEKTEFQVNCFEGLPKDRHPWIDTNWWTASSWSFPPVREIQHCCFRDH